VACNPGGEELKLAIHFPFWYCGDEWFCLCDVSTNERILHCSCSGRHRGAEEPFDGSAEPAGDKSTKSKKSNNRCCINFVPMCL